MTELRYPSDDFPAPVGVGVSIPDGWVPLPLVALPLAVGREVAEGEFNPNLIVLVSRIRADQSLDDAHAQALGALRPLPKMRELGGGDVEVDGHAGRWVEAQFRGGAGAVLVQTVRTVVVPRGPVADLVQLTGTCTVTQHPWAGPEIRQIAESLRIQE
ncbi:LpqN/LpqT family lipoprotein [Cellulosimicrobium arenosum]|uniref:LpqN/LpqT family lipoprotein n=1 Tax=Cellulosimicrobium arenosum TaxID=2708133 RepID=A0A927J2B2_9MICO|nr:LpqN/LpqT family lipoprotein [Cellulosimicrobium arenosum]MBD8080572.1 LpqN/LpqT family lipoprotein [Cellulosimicrobium arenosum]